jgi:hypothetical protein
VPVGYSGLFVGRDYNGSSVGRCLPVVCKVHGLVVLGGEKVATMGFSMNIEGEDGF